MSSDKDKFSFYRKLTKEIDIWLRENLITSDQKENILNRYASLKEADEKAGPGKLITTISVLGALLVGIGVILFVASNWSEIPRWEKLFIIFSSMLFSYGLGFYLCYEKQNFPKVGSSLILLGALIFGAGIFLIAQIYHISVHYPNGPLMWGLAVLPLAYVLRMKTLLTLAIIDILIWLGMESSYWLHASAFGSIMPFVMLYFMAGIALWSTGIMHKGFRHLKEISGPYVVTGALIAMSAGYVLTFDVFYSKLGSDTLFIFYSGAAALFTVSFIFNLFAKDRDKAWLPETVFLLIIMTAVFFLTVLYVPEKTAYSGFRYGQPHSMITICSNIVFALWIIGMIYLGYVRRYTAYINIGLLFFILDVFARYFDVFWRLLPRSLFFIIGGLMLILGSVVLEKKRRRILASFKIKEAD